ncbi:hypothetical protein XENORESO_005404 [Xenotaenia resolanae]|uniref:Uncharacterized protein n=1 Tax=Xenotaenia resolanae TaxID=208358 RepID=A0ABV0WPF4_9TELE
MKGVYVCAKIHIPRGPCTSLVLSIFFMFLTLSAFSLIVVQDAASKNSNNFLLDTSDLAISQYSLLGQTPPVSAPDSPAVQPRHLEEEAQSANKETAPVEEDQSKMPNVSPQSDAELNNDTKCDPSPAQSPYPSPMFPVIVVTQQFDEPDNKEGECLMETNEEGKSGGEAALAATDTTPGESANMDGAVTEAVDETDSGSAIQDSPDPASLVLIKTTDAQTEYAPSPESTSPENQVTPDLPTTDQTSDHASEETSSVQPPSPPQSPGTASPMTVSLGSLSEAIAPCSTEPVVQQTTDRAVYLTGQIKDNWEVEKNKEEKQREASENEENEGRDDERDGGQQEGVAQTGDHSVSEPCTPPAVATESAAVAIPELTGNDSLDDDQTEGEIPKEAKVEAAEEGEHAEEKENKDQAKREDLQSFQPMESHPETDSDPQVDSVSVIRDLVTEIIQVETIINPCESSSSTPPST